MRQRASADSLVRAVSISSALCLVFVIPASGADPGTRASSGGNELDQVERVSVTAPRLKGDELVGPNAQPSWTTRRPFAQTRVYVLPPWQLAAYTTWRLERSRSGDLAEESDDEGLNGGMSRIQEEEGEEGMNAEVENRLVQEIELGLPYRFQLEYEAEGGSTPAEWELVSQSIEARWALADWDVIPLNPTIFAEWKFRNAEADSYEIKLLLGEGFGTSWEGGVNLFFEQQVGDDREREFAATAAVNYYVNEY